MNDGDSASDHEEKTPYSLHSGDERRGLNRRRANFSPAVIWLNSIEELVIVVFAATSIVRSPARPLPPPPRKKNYFVAKGAPSENRLSGFPGTTSEKRSLQRFRNLNCQVVRVFIRRVSFHRCLYYFIPPFLRELL